MKSRFLLLQKASATTSSEFRFSNDSSGRCRTPDCGGQILWSALRLRGCLVIGQIEQHSGKGKTTNNISESCGDLIPQPPVRNGDWSIKHHGRWNDEHIYHTVLQSECKEGEDRQPDGDYLSDG